MLLHDLAVVLLCSSSGGRPLVPGVRYRRNCDPAGCFQLVRDRHHQPHFRAADGDAAAGAVRGRCFRTTVVRSRPLPPGPILLPRCNRRLLQATGF